MIAHDGSQNRFGGFPHVQLRVQLPAQAFHIEQGFLQQNKFRLHNQVEAACHLKGLEHYFAKGNLADGTGEIRFTHGANGRFQFVQPGVGRHPAGFDMQLGNAVVVLIKKSCKIIRQVALVFARQGAANAKVENDVARVVRVFRVHKNVPRVHIGVEEVVPKNLGVKQSDAFFGQFFPVNAGSIQLRELADGNGVYALHHHHFFLAVIPVHARNVQVWRAVKIFA